MNCQHKAPGWKWQHPNNNIQTLPQSVALWNLTLGPTGCSGWRYDWNAQIEKGGTRWDLPEISSWSLQVALLQEKGDFFPSDSPCVRLSHRACAVIDSVFAVKLRHPLNALWERHLVSFSRVFQRFAWDHNRWIQWNIEKQFSEWWQ